MLACSRRRDTAKGPDAALIIHAARTICALGASAPGCRAAEQRDEVAPFHD